MKWPAATRGCRESGIAETSARLLHRGVETCPALLPLPTSAAPLLSPLNPQLRGRRNFCLDIFLILVILSIAAYIASIIQKRKAGGA
jgi:hypothetical protein